MDKAKDKERSSESSSSGSPGQGGQGVPDVEVTIPTVMLTEEDGKSLMKFIQRRRDR